TADVRDLTRPLWELAENSGAGSMGEVRSGRSPLVTFVWGKAWNIPGVVTAVAEKLESFTDDGAPRRSWLRMRLLRVDQAAVRRLSQQAPPPPPESLSPTGPGPVTGLLAEPTARAVAEDIQTHEVIGGGEQPASGERLEVIARRYY